MQTIQAGIRSREAGYERELRAYVIEAAWVQARYSLGRKDVGYVSGVLFPGRERDQGRGRVLRAAPKDRRPRARSACACPTPWSSAGARGPRRGG